MIDFNKKYDYSSFEKLKKENPNIDPHYLRYRCDPEIWKNILKMYSITKDYLDSDFREKYIDKKDIKDGIWINRLRELMVWYALIKESDCWKKFIILKKENDAWPDFCIRVENRIVHIECICVGDEDVEKNRNNRTPKRQWRKSINLSWNIYWIDRPSWLRMSGGLREKTKKYYSHYKKNINNDDFFIVALTMANGLVSDPTRVLNSILYWVGNEIYRPNWGKLEFQWFDNKNHLKKIANEWKVESIKALFSDDYYSPVSLLMFHSIVVFWDIEFNKFWLNDFEFYHNEHQETNKFNGFNDIWKHY